MDKKKFNLIWFLYAMVLPFVAKKGGGFCIDYCPSYYGISFFYIPKHILGLILATLDNIMSKHLRKYFVAFLRDILSDLPLFLVNLLIILVIAFYLAFLTLLIYERLKNRGVVGASIYSPSKTKLIIAITIIVIYSVAMIVMAVKENASKREINRKSAFFNLANPPTRDNPLTIAPSDLELEVGKTGRSMMAFLYIGGYEGNLPSRQAIDEPGYCRLGFKNSHPEKNVPEVVFNSECIFVEVDRIYTWTLVFSAKSADIGSILFTFEMSCYKSRESCESEDASELISEFTKDTIVTVI